MSTDLILVPASQTASVPAVVAIPSQAADDAGLVALWLHGRSHHTQRTYAADAARFLAHVGKPLRLVTVGDVQAFGDQLVVDGLSDASRGRKLAAVKSLLAFGHRVGFLAFDVGAVVRLPAVKDTLAERIMERDDVVRMLALETNARNKALLSLIYYAGLRISEACGLVWRDLKPRDDAGQITVFGKGGKTRVILLPAKAWRLVVALRGDAGEDAAVFASREGGNLDPASVHRVVKAAAARAGLSDAVSAHWLRHAHASHALDRGAAPHLVRETLGHASLQTTSRYAHAKPGDSSAKYLD